MGKVRYAPMTSKDVRVLVLEGEIVEVFASEESYAYIDTNEYLTNYPDTGYTIHTLNEWRSLC